MGRGERAFRLDHGGGRLIVGGASFLHVGDRNEADFEPLVGLLELPGERLEGRLRSVYGVLAASTSK